MDIQEILVTNKKQLMAALWCADDAHADTLISIKGLKTQFFINKFSDTKKLRSRLRRIPARIFYG